VLAHLEQPAIIIGLLRQFLREFECLGDKERDGRV
jgi:hypothetical protein